MNRSIVTIDDLSNKKIESIFDLADEYVAELGEDPTSHRLSGRLSQAGSAASYIAATLFYEPSTRTKFSFESAMLRLGGQVIGSSDPKTMSAAKGESLADTIRVVQGYADIIILRHPLEGAARVAADYASVPVINAGDGSHEHPTQTLCDLYTLRRENKKLAGSNFLICGDLKNGRTVHSLVFALARFGAHIIPAPARGLELPSHVVSRLRSEYGCRPVPRSDLNNLPDDRVDVIYVTPKEPHQPALFTHPLDVGLSNEQLDEVKKALRSIDVCYVTRFQVERIDGNGRQEDYPVVDREFLKQRRYRDTQVLHPLPRVNELSYDLDNDARGAYFRQTAYGVPIRMALIARLLGLKPFPEERTAAKTPSIYSPEKGITCGNERCISRHEPELSYLRPKFCIANFQEAQPPKNALPVLRCVYCEHEYRPELIGKLSTKKYTSDFSGFDLSSDDVILFENEDQARNANFRPAGIHERTAARH